MKTYTVELTVVIRVEVPDRKDCPINAGSLRRTIEWKANDWRDGRYPATTEQISFWAEREVELDVRETIFQGVCDWEKYRTAGRIDERNRVVDQFSEGIRVHALVGDGKLLVNVYEGSGDFVPFNAVPCADAPKSVCQGKATQSFMQASCKEKRV